VEQKNLNYKYECVLQRGQWIAQRINVVAYMSFAGKGSLQGDDIRILTSEFNFKGTIACNGNCFILSCKPFDQNQFTRSGQGVFTIATKEEAAKAWSKQKAEDFDSWNENVDRLIRMTAGGISRPQLSQLERECLQQLAAIPLDSILEQDEG